MIDYHLHTLFCNHAEGSMRTYVENAIKIGLKEICFLDHLTIRKTEKRLSMTPEEIPYYFQAVQDLKQRYKSMIRIKAGLEIDFNPDYAGLFLEIAGIYDFDVIATSLHFLNGLDIVSSHSPWRHGENDTDDVYGLYFEALEKMLDYSYFDVICHVDLLKKFGRKPAKSYKRALNTILSKIKKQNLTLEVNTSGYDYPIGETYPSPDLLKRCFKRGISITLGSDAHHPGDVGRHFDRALSTLFSIGYRQLATFTKRKRHDVFIENLDTWPIYEARS